MRTLRRRRGFSAAGAAVSALLAAACGGGAEPPAPGPLPPPEDAPAAAAAWPEAAARGIDFRAVGQQPVWLLEVDHDRGVRLIHGSARQQEVSSAPLTPQVEQGTTLYRATTPGGGLEVAIEEGACRDAASGESLPRTVTVNLGGRAFRGCGRPLP